MWIFSVHLMANHTLHRLDAIVNPPAAEMVRLDLGGERLVEMSRSSLLHGRAADSLLAAAVQHHLAAQRNDTYSSASTSAGAPLFVDASAASLQPVLAWLRTGIPPCIAAPDDDAVANDLARSLRLSDLLPFTRRIAAARAEMSVLASEHAAALRVLSRSPRCALNPRYGLLPRDVLDFHLQPLVQPPHLVVCAAGRNHDETHALPLSAASPTEWVRLDDKRARNSSNVVREGVLMLTGGFQHDCSLLSPRTSHWHDGPSMPTKRTNHCFAQLGGVSVMCGGEDFGPLSSTLLLPAGDAAQWKRGCEMTTARAAAGGAAVAAADARAHRLLVVGGWNPSRKPLDSCELFDAAADRWSMQEARLPEVMYCRAASIAGGSAVLAVQDDSSRKMRCALFDLRSSSPLWQPMASPVSASRAHAVAAVGEYSVVILGGEDAYWLPTDNVQLYDARADRWSAHAVWCLPAPSSGVCAAVFE